MLNNHRLRNNRLNFFRPPNNPQSYYQKGDTMKKMFIAIVGFVLLLQIVQAGLTAPTIDYPANDTSYSINDIIYVGWTDGADTGNITYDLRYKKEEDAEWTTEENPPH